MKLLSLKEDSRLAVKTDTGIVDTLGSGAGVPKTLTTLLEGGTEARRQLDSFVGSAKEVLDEANLEFAPCVPQPGKIVCVGLTYRRHAAEAGMAVPEQPVLFSKYSNSLAAHGEGVPLPRVAKECDYEAELVIVMGRKAKNISEADALEAVFGYCNANDLSARDLQMLSGQWMLGKTLDKFLPLGPYLVTADEVGDPQTLQVRCWLNGELRQDSYTSDMIFSVRELVSYISRYMTLEPGDIILTGTPEGVIFGLTDKVWLAPGDEVTIEIEKLGRLTSVMQAEA